MDKEYEELASWFLARSDVEAALKVASGSAQLQEYINGHWPQVSCDKAYGRVYAEAGPIEAATPDAFQGVKHAWRLQMARSYLTALAAARDVRIKALDFGCSRAYYSTHLHNDTWVKDWTCIDIDATSVEDARKQVCRNAKEPSRFTFAVGGEDDIPGDGYGVAMLFEVLEHVRDPRRVLQVIEGRMIPDGLVMLSLPSGPVEYSMWFEHPERNREHIREYTLDDIYDCFGGKPGLQIHYCSYGPNKYLPSMIDGCHFVIYRRSDQPIGSIDWDRKLKGVRPGVPLPGL